MLQGWPCPQPRTCPRPGTLPILCSAVFFRETWAASPPWGGLAAVSAFSQKLPEAKSFSFHLVRPARLPGAQGPKSDVACLRCREEEEERCWERAGSVAKWSPWDSANLPRRKECRAGEMQSAGNCGCSSTQASPSSAGPEPPPRPLTPTQLPAPRGHIPFLVSGSILCGNHQSWAPAASWTPRLAELCVFGSQRPLRAGAVALGRQLLGRMFLINLFQLLPPAN